MASQILLGTSRPVRPLDVNTHAKRNHANHPLLSGKRFDATEDRERRPISVRCSVRYRGHASDQLSRARAL